MVKHIGFSCQGVSVNWIHLAQDKVVCHAVVSTVRNLLFGGAFHGQLGDRQLLNETRLSLSSKVASVLAHPVDNGALPGV
jgi:hypothetical protein